MRIGKMQGTAQPLSLFTVSWLEMGKRFWEGERGLEHARHVFLLLLLLLMAHADMGFVWVVFSVVRFLPRLSTLSCTLSEMSIRPKHQTWNNCRLSLQRIPLRNLQLASKDQPG